MNLLDYLDRYNYCYAVVASDTFCVTDWFVLIHRKDYRKLRQRPSGVFYYDLKPDNTFDDEIFQFDLSREEVVYFFDMLRSGRFVEVVNNDSGIVYEMPKSSFKVYCSLMPKKRIRRELIRKCPTPITKELQ